MMLLAVCRPLSAQSCNCSSSAMKRKQRGGGGGERKQRLTSFSQEEQLVHESQRG